MLKEQKYLKQEESGKKRRWFSDDDFDLIVWFEENREIHGFQLCYDKQGRERSLTWRSTTGFSHETIDDGEYSPFSYKMSPIMIADGGFDMETVLNLFRAGSAEIDREIARFVARKILELSCLS